ncbi:MAG: cation:proton antiporter [Pirellulales bacterium]
MQQNLELILTLTGGLAAALALGFLTQRLGLSPLVGYLLAGIAVGPNSPGFVADRHLAEQVAEVGVILLLFGVGLHFRVEDLIAVRRVALPGAVAQTAATSALGAGAARVFGWGWPAAATFGLSVSVASTVVLTRMLAERKALHTPLGHVAYLARRTARSARGERKRRCCGWSVTPTYETGLSAACGVASLGSILCACKMPGLGKHQSLRTWRASTRRPKSECWPLDSLILM